MDNCKHVLIECSICGREMDCIIPDEGGSCSDNLPPPVCHDCSIEIVPSAKCDHCVNYDMIYDEAFYVNGMHYYCLANDSCIDEYRCDSAEDCQYYIPRGNV